MAGGLWLSNEAATELCDASTSLDQLRRTLAQCGIELMTLNGFPYGDFHRQQVKSTVYQPGWDNPARYDYSLKLARILAACLPRDIAEGTISTVPLGSADAWSELHHRQAVEQLLRISEALAQLHDKTGKQIRLCLEMEPGCVLEHSDQLIDFFVKDLEAGRRRLGMPRSHIDHHLGVCFDVCHQAVMFEDVEASLARINAAGIVIGKIQLSSAIHAPSPDQAQSREALAPFIEPRYLHQVRTHDNQGNVAGTLDLDQALAGRLPTLNPWRIHFHVPLQLSTIANGLLTTTRHAVEAVLDFLAHTPGFRPLLEVETYTWQVLPREMGAGNEEALIQGIARELDWVEAQMSKRGLLA